MTKLNQMQVRIDQLVNEHQIVKKNYESQIRMLSEHIVELNITQTKGSD